MATTVSIDGDSSASELRTASKENMPSAAVLDMLATSVHDSCSDLFTQLATLHSTLLKHREEVSYLRAENKLLREKLGPIVDIDEYMSSLKNPQRAEVIGSLDEVNVTLDQGVQKGLESEEQKTSPRRLKETAKAPCLEEERQEEQVEAVLYVTSSKQSLDNEGKHMRSANDAAKEANLMSTEQQLEQVEAGDGGDFFAAAHGMMLGKQTVWRDERGHDKTMTNLSIIQKIVFRKSFECGTAALICVNSLIMALELQYHGFELAFDLDFHIEKYSPPKSAADTWPSAKKTFDTLEMGFNIAFCVELLLRILANGKASMYSLWLWFDGAVILSSAINTVGEAFLSFNPAMLRLLRILRLIRLLRILKALSAFDSLFLLLKAMKGSISAATWSFVMLVAVQIILGMIMCQVLQGFIDDTDQAMEARHMVFKYFGTFSLTILTMFQITMSNWIIPCRDLVTYVGEWMTLFFILYRCFFCFAIMKVIAAIFITETNRVLENDEELTIMKRHREQKLFDHKVRHLVHAINTFDGRTLTWAELEELATDSDVTILLASLGFELKDLEKLFFILDNGTGRVEVDKFLQRMSRLRGTAKAIDLLAVLHMVGKMDQQVNGYFKSEIGKNEENTISDL